MLVRTAGIILVLSLWNVFDGVQGQTCTYRDTCSQLAVVHYNCGSFGQICYHYYLIYYNCDKTEDCSNSFSLWSACTASCTPGGTRQRTRTCTTGGGQACTATETESCNAAVPCVGSVDGNWGPWTSWSESSCSVTCCRGIGSETRTRLCNNPPPSGGGATCPGSATDTRSGVSCGSDDNQCPVTCTSSSDNFADTCRRCVRNYYNCNGALVPVPNTCSILTVWSQALQACVLRSVCNAVEPN